MLENQGCLCGNISYTVAFQPVQMFYLGSLLGLYFPYDFCLYPNATAVEVHTIRYIPFIVALVVCTVFGVLTRLGEFNDPVSPILLHYILCFNELCVWPCIVWSADALQENV